MTTDTHTVSIGGLQVSVVRKPIKNLHLGVYPPDGRVRVAAPQRVIPPAIPARASADITPRTDPRPP